MGSIYIQEEEEDMANELIWSFPSGVPCLLVEVDVETDIMQLSVNFAVCYQKRLSAPITDGCATMWSLGIELGNFERAASAFNR